MSLNRVLLVGQVTDAGPKLGYSERGSPECRLTLKLSEESKAGQAFSVFIPVFVYGSGAESAAEQVDAGDLVSVDGKLSFRAELRKNGCKVGVVVACFGGGLEVLQKAAIPAEIATSGGEHGA